MFTRLGVVLHIPVVLRWIADPAYRDGLVHQEQPADHLPFSRPEQSYTVQRQTHTHHTHKNTHMHTRTHEDILKTMGSKVD